jgi:tRNA 2-thiocytidine biosynthesis protein TtcA
VVPSHLMDPNLFDFAQLRADGVVNPDGDKAFDEESFAEPDVFRLTPSSAAVSSCS